MANLPCEVLYLLTKKIYNVYSPPLGGGPTGMSRLRHFVINDLIVLAFF